MKKEFEHIDDLIGKYLSGEASESESAFLNRWILEDADNKRYFDQMSRIFSGAAVIREWKDYDTDAAWNKLRINLKKSEAPVVPLHRPQKQVSFPLWKVAAAVLVLFVVGLFIFLPSKEALKPVEVIAEKKAVSDTLPDGSSVFLNKETRVVYAFDQKTKRHDVKLKGEAYFSIKHNNREEFVIDVGEVFIKDIGTSFNVKAYPDSDSVEVLVEEGEIIFFTADNPGIRLKESGRAIYNKKTKQFTIDEPEPNITAYKTKFFIFSNSDLASVAASLNQVYDVQVVVPEHLKSCPITVSFRNETIEEIAAVIAETLSLTVTHETGKIVLKGKACE